MIETQPEPAHTEPRKPARFVRHLSEWYFELAHRTIVAGAILYACRELTGWNARAIQILTTSFLGIWTVTTAGALMGEILPNWPPRLRRDNLSWKGLVALAFLGATVFLQIQLVNLVMAVVQVLAKRAE